MQLLCSALEEVSRRQVISRRRLLDMQTSLAWRLSPDRLPRQPGGQPMNVACCLLVAAVAFTAWCRNEYIVVAHLHLLIRSSSTIIINAYLHSLASPLYHQQVFVDAESYDRQIVLPVPYSSAGAAELIPLQLSAKLRYTD